MLKSTYIKHTRLISIFILSSIYFGSLSSVANAAIPSQVANNKNLLKTWEVDTVQVYGSKGSKGLACSGLLWSPTIVVTSAHCIKNTYNYVVEQQLTHLEVTFVPVDYLLAKSTYIEGVVSNNDIAVLHLSKPLTFINYKVVSPNKDSEDKLLSFIGWGGLEGISDNILRVTSLMPEVTYKNDIANGILVGRVLGEKNSVKLCPGDSGGPLVSSEGVLGIASGMVVSKKGEESKCIGGSSITAQGHGSNSVFTLLGDNLSWIEAAIKYLNSQSIKRNVDSNNISLSKKVLKDKVVLYSKDRDKINLLCLGYNKIINIYIGSEISFARLKSSYSVWCMYKNDSQNSTYYSKPIYISLEGLTNSINESLAMGSKFYFYHESNSFFLDLGDKVIQFTTSEDRNKYALKVGKLYHGLLICGRYNKTGNGLNHIEIYSKCLKTNIDYLIYEDYYGPHYIKLREIKISL